MKEHVFAGLDGGPRQEKPRRHGFTMVIDWGLGSGAQADLLEVGAAHFDLAKIAVGVSRLLPEAVLRRKIERYRAAGVEPFPGGQFLEYAEMEGRADGYLPAAAAAGYRWMEVSDNLAPVALSWKQEMIRRAVADFGMAVLGEVGKKEGLVKGVAMVDDARACLDAGATIVLLEAAELVDPATAGQVEEVVGALGLERVMF
jgi:phosphosulfolactate synthase